MDNTLHARKVEVVRVALRVNQLSVRFGTPGGFVQAISDMTFRVEPGERLVIVGESGSGKTVLAHALLGLLPMNARMQGEVALGDTLLTNLSEAQMAKVRRRSITLIPQSASTALNPVLTLGTQLREIAKARGLAWDTAQGELEGVLSSLGLRFSDVRNKYPHQLSGGMQQRIVIAAALIGNPALVVADEPTFGLDPELVDTTAILLREAPRRGAALLVITHDLRFAKQLEGRIAVMYGSYLVELSEPGAFFSEPLHPYSRGLLAALPEHGLQEIPGHPPSLTALPKGCPFAPRCPHVSDVCIESTPRLVPVERSLAVGESAAAGEGVVATRVSVDVDQRAAAGADGTDILGDLAATKGADSQQDVPDGGRVVDRVRCVLYAAT